MITKRPGEGRRVENQIGCWCAHFPLQGKRPVHGFIVIYEEGSWY